MPVVVVHMTVGGAVVVLNWLAGLWGLVVWRRRRAVSALLQQTIALSHTVVLAQAALGLFLLTGNHRAPVQLHYVYGLLPAGAVLFGYSARTDDGRRNLLVFSLVAVVIGGLAIRAFMTGKGV
jgi:hypothetical protein